MNSFYKNKSITDYFKFIFLLIMFLFGLVFKASTGDFVLLVVLVLIEFAFKIGFKYINSINYTISNNFYKNILKMLNILNFEFDFLFVYIFFDSLLGLNIKYFIGIIFTLLIISIFIFSFFISLNLLINKHIYNFCQSFSNFTLSEVDNKFYKKLSVLSSCKPSISFSIHLSFLDLKIIKESKSSLIYFETSYFNL